MNENNTYTIPTTALLVVDQYRSAQGGVAIDIRTSNYVGNLLVAPESVAEIVAEFGEGAMVLHGGIIYRFTTEQTERYESGTWTVEPWGMLPLFN